LTVDDTTEDSIADIDLQPGETKRYLFYWVTESGDEQAADYDVCVETNEREDCITVNVDP